MTRNITVYFSDGTAHQYNNAPDDFTPDQVEARTKKDYPNKKITKIDGGNKSVAKPAAKTSTKPEAGVVLKLDSWRHEHEMILSTSFTITNNNPYPIKDISIECHAFAESGTLIDRNNRDIFTVIQPGQTKTYKDFSMGFLRSQVEKVGCRIKNVEKAN